MDSCLKHLSLGSPAPLLQATVEERGRFKPFLMRNSILSKMGAVCQSKFVLMKGASELGQGIKLLTNNREYHKIDDKFKS